MWFWWLVLVVIVGLVIFIANDEHSNWNMWKDPCNHKVPEFTELDGTLRDFYGRRAYYSDQWGSPEIDGPDKNMPSSCFWLRGVLHCIEKKE